MERREQYGLYINGQFVEPLSGEYTESINPADQSVVTRVARGNEADLEAAINAAEAAQQEWADMRPLERGKILISVGREMEKHLPAFAKAESDEMGMPIPFAMSVLQGAANYYQYYGGLAPSIQGDHIDVGPNQHSYTIHDPYGVVGVITPWNVPLNQSARSIAPALASGNCVVHKPAESTSLTALMFSEIAEKAGLPAGVLNVLTGSGRKIGMAMARHEKIGKIAFTGSQAVGEQIGAIAGERIIPVTLELGGKSPDIIFEDADLSEAIPSVVSAFVANSGQICTAGTRVLIQRSIYDKVSAMIKGAVENLPLGVDKPFPTLGPIANESQYNTVLNYFEVAKQDGAKLVTGGEKATGEGLDQGFYIKPTVYADVNNNMRIAREEIFGPVGVLIPFDTDEEAIAIANDSDFGLAAGVWTQNLSRAHRVARKIESGQVFVNYYMEGGCEHPLGGYKKSGIGREKGIVALKAYTQLKNITMKL